MTAATAHNTAANLDLDAINAELKGASAQAIIQWSADTFKQGLILTSSFGAESALMLHLATQALPNIPVVVVDTGYLFPETYKFIELLHERLGLNLKVYQSPISPARMEATHGRLWEKGTVDALNTYDRLRKVEPMQRALKELGVGAWLAGLRSNQTQHRASLRTVEKLNGVYKVHPILGWSSKDIFNYFKQHDLPYHPLFEKGYASIGDVHSTVSVTEGMNARDGRFQGLKQECGLHLPETQEEDSSRSSSDL